MEFLNYNISIRCLLLWFHFSRQLSIRPPSSSISSTSSVRVRPRAPVRHGADGDAHRRADWWKEPRGPAEPLYGGFDFHESASDNISGIWCNLSPALIRFVSAHTRTHTATAVPTHFHGPVKFLRSRLKGSSFPCGSIRRIIVLLGTTQLFNYQDLSPRSFLSSSPLSPLSLSPFFFLFWENWRSVYINARPWHDNTRGEEQRVTGGSIRLEVWILEELFITI